MLEPSFVSRLPLWQRYAASSATRAFGRSGRHAAIELHRWRYLPLKEGRYFVRPDILGVLVVYAYSAGVHAPSSRWTAEVDGQEAIRNLQANKPHVQEAFKGTCGEINRSVGSQRNAARH